MKQTTPKPNFSTCLKQVKPFFVEERQRTGRRKIAADYQVAAMLLYCKQIGVFELKAAWNHFKTSRARQGFKMPSYPTFCRRSNLIQTGIEACLRSSLSKASKIALVDSTPIEVSAYIRAGRHKTLRPLSAFGVSSKGKFYGIKGHFLINENQELVNYCHSPGNEHDQGFLAHLLSSKVNVVIGDNHYNGSNLRRKILKNYNCRIIAKPHHTQKTPHFKSLYKRHYHKRKRIETMISVLKETFKLVSSKHRSIAGFSRNLHLCLLSYQLHRLARKT